MKTQELKTLRSIIIELASNNELYLLIGDIEEAQEIETNLSIIPEHQTDLAIREICNDYDFCVEDVLTSLINQDYDVSIFINN